MAKFNFDIPTRFDEEQAREGVWFAVEDEHEQMWDKVAMEVFLSCVLLDWKNVKAGGKDVPYSKEAAEAYFDLPQVKSFAWPALLQYASDVRWYNDKAADQGVDPVVDKEETLGNS